MDKVIVITGASSGFGALTARALARAGHTVYAGIRESTERNAPRVAELESYARDNGVDLRAIEMDVASQESVDAAIATTLATQGRLDVVVHNAGHLVTGPMEAFTPEEIAATFDTNVLSTQRVNRAVLPQLRAQRHGLVVWVSSSSVKGGTPPYLAPYFAAKAAMDSLAVSYAAELARFGVETAIIVPGAFPTGTNHFANAGHPADRATAAAYEALYPQLLEQIGDRLVALMPAGADVGAVAVAIVEVVGLPDGRRPFRTHIDPADDGSAVVSAVADRMRTEFLRRVGLDDVLHAGLDRQAA